MPRKKWLGARSGTWVRSSAVIEALASAMAVSKVSPAPSETVTVWVSPPGPAILASASASSGWRGLGSTRATQRKP